MSKVKTSIRNKFDEVKDNAEPKIGWYINSLKEKVKNLFTFSRKTTEDVIDVPVLPNVWNS